VEPGGVYGPDGSVGEEDLLARQEAQHFRREKVGPGVHGRVSVLGHDDHTGIGQRLVHGFPGLLKGGRAVASAQQQRWQPEIAKPLRIQRVSLDRSQLPRDRERRVHPRLPYGLRPHVLHRLGWQPEARLRGTNPIQGAVG
jgi:hypothetical protein